MHDSQKQGTFIAFEGCEGVGKSTQLELLKKYFLNTNRPAVFTREPGGTPLAEKIREVILSDKNQVAPITEAYLFAAARAEHMREVILPALAKGMLVVCDRFILSSLAYQGKARGFGFQTVLDINKHACTVFPDVTLFLDMKPNESFRKKNGKTVEGDRMENESDSFHNLVYEGFKEAQENYKSIVSITPSQNKADTLNDILKVLKQRGFIK
jgi:dTMP kinase